MRGFRHVFGRAEEVSEPPRRTREKTSGTQELPRMVSICPDSPVFAF